MFEVDSLKPSNPYHDEAGSVWEYGSSVYIVLDEYVKSDHHLRRKVFWLNTGYVGFIVEQGLFDKFSVRMT